MAIEKGITNPLQKELALVGCLLLCALFALPAHAAAPQNSDHYPGYDAATEGEIDLTRYVKSVTLTVNGQEYTPQKLQEMQQNGTPLEMRVGDSASINFRFALCGRAYAADDPTRLDEAASTQTVYTNGTTYLNGETVAAGETGILDDSSLMSASTTQRAGSPSRRRATRCIRTSRTASGRTPTPTPATSRSASRWAK